MLGLDVPRAVLAITDEVIERAFRNAAIVGGENSR
jgi:hypothetical protein